jgi:hypothetical protein
MSRGGKRPGAGRPAGSPNQDTAARRAALADLMEGHIETAIAALSEIAKGAESEAARVSAACAILDRCFGRPAQAVQHDGLPPAGPTRIEIVPADVTSALDSIAARLSSSALQEIVAAQDAIDAERGLTRGAQSP